jgi:RecJ-like exonuclease
MTLNKKCPDCEALIDDKWRTGRCDECRGIGRDKNDDMCVYCDGTGSPVCCRCEGTGIDRIE